MKVLKENRDGVMLLTLKGEFDSFVCAGFTQEVAAVQAEGVHHIALNLRLVKFINSTALGAIIKASKILAANGLDVRALRPYIRDTKDATEGMALCKKLVGDKGESPEG